MRARWSVAALALLLAACCLAPRPCAAEPAAVALPTPVTSAADLLGPEFRPTTGWLLAELSLGPGLARVHFDGPAGAKLVVRVTPKVPGERAFAETKGFAVAHEGRLDATADAAALALLGEVVAALRAHDDGSRALPPKGAGGAGAGSSRGDAAGRGHASGPGLSPHRGIARFAGGAGQEVAPFAAAQLWIAEALLALFALALLLRALPTALGTLWRGPERRPVFVALGLAALGRLLVPSTLVTMFMGYRQTDLALLLEEIPRYGAGGHVLHHVALQVLGVDHESVATLHRLLAILTLPLLVAWVARFSARPGAATAAAVLVGSAPLLIHGAATESNLIPIVLALWTGGWLLWRWLQDGHRLDLLAAVPAFGFAMVSRPEQLVVAPGFAVALALASGERERLRRAAPGLVALALLLAALALPHARNTIERSTELHAGFAPLIWLPVRVFLDNIVFWPHHFPIVTTALAALGLAFGWGAERRRLVWLWLFLLLWGGVYTLDLPRISVPRLMAGSATVVCALAAAALPELLATLRDRDPARFPRRRALIFGAWLLATVATVPVLLRPSNQRLEETMFRRALALLPAEPACILRLGDHDPPYGREVHRYHPDYLFRARGHRVLDLREGPAPAGCRQTYALLGTRCYARDRATPTEKGPNQSCRELRARARLQPLWEERAPVQWDDPFAWWRQQDGFVVGFYRVESGEAARGGDSRR
ncbi:MAG: glycosyltransferase family 39 protein [Deltaproteobacteria bacterium]|nr:glycosyltransferase family 39 protein [Deltaproteobacteria bacterium]